MQSNSIKMQWVVARYEGEHAKAILAHSGNYQILQQGKIGSQVWVIAAFMRPFDDVVPAHLTVVTDAEKIARLDATYRQLHGAQIHSVHKAELFSPAKERLREWFANRKQQAMPEPVVVTPEVANEESAET